MFEISLIRRKGNNEKDYITNLYIKSNTVRLTVEFKQYLITPTFSSVLKHTILKLF